MKHAKLLLAIVLIIILVFALVACGEKDPVDNGGTQGPQNGVGPDDNPGDNPGETPDDNPDSGVEIVVGDNGNWFINGIDTYIKEADFTGMDILFSAANFGSGAPDETVVPGAVNAYIDIDTLDMYWYNSNGNEWLFEGSIPWLYASHEGTYGLKFVKINDTECVVSAGNTYEINEIVVPSTYLGYAVVGFLERKTDNYGGMEGAFQGRSNITKITLPDTIKTIGKYAFYNCVSLKSIVIPEGVTLIGVSAFAGCTSLENIAIPDSIVTIYQNAFDGCDGLKTVYYDGTFEQWENITFANSTANPMEYALKLYAEGKLVTSAVTQGVDTVNHTITVGNTAATSGAFASVGVPFNYAQEAYFWYFENCTEGYKDAAGNKYTIDFKHYDDGFVAATGVTYTEKLVEDDEVFALVGHFGANTVSATTDYIEEAGIPMVYGVCGVSDLYNAERNVMAVQPIYDTEGQSMVATAFAPVSAGGLGATKVGVISTTDDAGKGMLNGIQIEVAKLGKGDEVVYQTAGAADTDYATQVTALKTAGCDVVIIAANQLPFVNIANTFTTVGYDNVKILTSYVSANYAVMGGLVATGVISATREVYAGAWLVTGSMPAETKGWNDFVEYVKVMTLYAKHNGEALITTADSTYGPYVALYFGEYDWAADGVSAYFLNSYYAMAGYVSANVFCQGLSRMSGKDLLWGDYILAMEEAPINVPMGLSVNYADGQRIGVDAFALNKYTLANLGVGEVYREITSLADLEDAVVG